MDSDCSGESEDGHVTTRNMCQDDTDYGSGSSSESEDDEIELESIVVRWRDDPCGNKNHLILRSVLKVTVQSFIIILRRSLRKLS